MKTRLIALLLVGLLFLCACSGHVSVNSFPKANKPLKVGDTFSISLEGNATTGYAWEYEMLPKDAFELIKFEAKAQSSAVGAPSNNIWVFKALKPAAGTLIFRYHRPWEEAEPLTLLRYEVTVE